MTIRVKSAARNAGCKPAPFKPTRTLTASRASLLFGTALGCSIAIMAASPSQAWAADECGGDLGGVVVCTATTGTANPYPTGIDYVADAGEDITVILVGGGVITAVTVVTATDDGVSAIGVAGFDVAVNAFAGASIAAFNDGIDVYASAGGTATVINYAGITSGAQGIEAQALGAGADISVLNYGNILINGDTNAGYAFADGIYAEADDSLVIINSGLIEAASTSDFSVYGINVTSVAGYATVINTNDIDVSNTFFYGVGISSTGADGILVTQDGDIDVYAADETYGIRTLSLGGAASVILVGDVSVESGQDEAIGVSAVSVGGLADIDITGDVYSDVDDITEANTGVYALSLGVAGIVDIDIAGDITVSDGADATGIDVLATGAVDVDVLGDIQVGDFPGTTDTGLATGIDVRSYFSTADVTLTGNVDVYGTRNASGVEAVAAGDATVTVTGAIYAYSTAYNGLGILAQSSGGDASVTLTGGVIAYGEDYADGILAFSSTGDASVTVTGNVSAEAYRYGAHGLYLYAGDAAYVDMSGDIDVQAYGAAYGILARADVIEIDMAGDIAVAADNGVAFGIYAAANGAVDIGVTGDIYTDVDNAFLNNTGILATSFTSSVDLVLVGDLTVSDGAFATAIDAYAADDLSIDVTGDIQVGDYAGSIYTFFAHGIDASSSAGDVDAALSGDVTSFGYIDAIGVELDSTVGDVAFTGAGSVTAYGTLDDATAVDLSAALTVTAEFTGDVAAYASDEAIGVLADGASVDVTIDGDITVDGSTSYGVLATSSTGDLYVGVGGVEASAGSYATGIDVQSASGDVTVATTGLIDVYSLNDQAYGVYAVADDGSIEITVGDLYAYSGGISGIQGRNGAGVFADGDDGVSVVATGTITTLTDNTQGVDAYSLNGDVYISVENVYTQGVSAHAAVGFSVNADATIVADGTIETDGDFAAALLTHSTFGDASTSSTGDITTLGFASTAVLASSYFGDAYAYNGGTINTAGVFADGVFATSNNGDASVVNNGDVYITGDSANGLYAYAFFGGSAQVVSTGNVSTSGYYSNGIYAASINFDAYAYSSGVVTTTGDRSLGITVESTNGDSSLVNEGSVYTSGDYSHGLKAYAYNGVATVDNADGHVETEGDFAYGIYAYGYSGVWVQNGNNTVITSGYSAVGIFAFSAGDYVYVDSGTVITSGDNSPGIVAVSLADYVEVHSDYVETSGNNSTGIYAYAIFGDAYVESFDVETTGDNSTGISAYSVFGDATVDSFNVYTDGLVSTGIAAISVYGDATVYSDYVFTGGDFSTGIYAAADDGFADVYSFSVYTDGAYSAGIVALGFDGVEVDSSFVNTEGYAADGIVGISAGNLVDIDSYSVRTYGDYADGIVALGFGYYDAGAGQAYAGSVRVESTFIITHGYKAYGIVATAEGGDATVFSTSLTRTYGDYSTGIYAAAFNYYDAGLLIDLQGEVYVSSNALGTYGYGSTGIDTYAQGGDITVFSNWVRTFGAYADGIDANAAYYFDGFLGTYNSGDVYVASGRVTTYGDGSDGIHAYAGGGDVYVRGVYTLAFGFDADAIYAGTGGADASNSDNVYVHTYGTVYAYDGVGIAVNSAGFSSIYTYGSTYGFDWAIQSNSADGTYIYNGGTVSGGNGRAIDVDGGAAFIQNNGDLYGFIDLTDNNDHVEQDGYWSAYGASSFGAGTDDVDNDGVLAFSRYTGAAATTTFTGLEFFDNSSLITSYDNQVNDQLVMTGTSFTGAGASEFEFDVQLGGPGSAADRLFIGSAQGSTLLTPNDVLAGQPGALNFGGILVVDSSNAAEVGNEFNMANVDKGFIEYSLFFDAANDNWLIVSLPDDEAFELLGAMSSSQDFWRRSGDAVFARWQEVRDSSGAGLGAGPGGSGRSEGWELWMQAHGGGEEIENLETYTLGGFFFAPDLSVDIDNRGFQFGFDNLQGNAIWGLTMGFNQQEMKFDFDGNSFDTEGWNIGAYAGWANDGFFINGLLKGSFYEVDGNFHTIPTLFTFDGTTWGAEGEIGYRWGDEGFFFEPIAALSWTTTSLDSVTTGGATIDFDDSTSLRGRAGARIGGTMGSGDVILTPYIGAYWVDELDGDNSLTFTTGPTSISFSDSGMGSHGLVDFGFTAQTFYGLEGFVKGEWNFGGDVDGGTARLGVRWRW